MLGQLLKRNLMILGLSDSIPSRHLIFVPLKSLYMFFLASFQWGRCIRRCLISSGTLESHIEYSSYCYVGSSLFVGTSSDLRRLHSLIIWPIFSRTGLIHDSLSDITHQVIYAGFAMIHVMRGKGETFLMCHSVSSISHALGHTMFFYFDFPSSCFLPSYQYIPSSCKHLYWY